MFGFEMSDTARVTSLNQMGVALSRARSRLIVRENGIFAPFISKNDDFAKTARDKHRESTQKEMPFFAPQACGR